MEAGGSAGPAGASGAPPAAPELLRALRFAITFDPPAITLEYSTPKGPRLRKVHLKDLGPNANVDRLVEKVLAAFPKRLDSRTISTQQVRRLLQRLVDSRPPAAPRERPASAIPALPTTASSPATASPPAAVAPVAAPAATPATALIAATAGSAAAASAPPEAPGEEPLGRAAPLLPPTLSESPRLPPTAAGPAGFSTGAGSSRDVPSGPVHPLRVAPLLGALPPVALPPGGRLGPLPPLAPLRPGSAPPASPAPPPISVAVSAPALVLDPSVDLNRVSVEELQAAKAHMDRDFERNRKVRGSADFVYDVRVNFEPCEPADWDDD